ncbi:MAG: SEL1-like repeat protein [Pseudomonadota bacterium]
MRLTALLVCIFVCGCAAAPSTDNVATVRFRSDGVSPQLREACDLSDVVVGTPAHQREVNRCQDLTRQHRDDQRRFDMSAFGKALYEGDCDAVRRELDPLEGRYMLLTADAVFMAGRLRKGLCVDADPAKAAALLEEELSEHPYNPLVLAHLGDMLWKGEGVAMDKARAKRLFKRAADAALPQYIEDVHLAKTLPSTDPRNNYFWRPTDGALWSYSLLQLSANFAHPILGPWQFPQALYDQRMRMEAIVHASGDAAVREAQQLLKGNENAREMGASLLFWAASAGYHPAARVLADILASSAPENLPDQLSVYGNNPECHARFILGRAASYGYLPAMSALTGQIVARARRQLPPDIFKRMIEEPNVPMYVLQDDVTSSTYGLIAAMHDFVALYLAHGLPVPDGLQPLARRILFDVSDPSSVMIPAPFYSGGTLADDGYFI